MIEPVRWGILGAAKFAREHMAPAIHAAEGAELAALATRDPAKADAFKAFCPGLRIHGDYDALLADPGIDAVYIPLPNHMHFGWTKKALAAGKHVLCEKPMTMATGEFDDLIAARDASGCLAAEAYMIVHHPQWQWAQARLAAGDIGRLVHVSGRFSFDNRDEPGNIRNRPETGGGALRDIGVYVIGSARFVTGTEPVAVSGSIRWENGVDVFSRIAAEFPGFTYDAYVSTRAHPAQEMVFHGDAGVMTLTAPFNARVFGEARVIIEGAELTRTERRFPAADHYVLQVAAFCRSVRDGTAYPCPLEFSRGTQVMMDRVFSAAATLG
jgi:predicted dehydrogenase